MVEAILVCCPFPVLLFDLKSYLDSTKAIIRCDLGRLKGGLRSEHGRGPETSLAVSVCASGGGEPMAKVFLLSGTVPVVPRELTVSGWNAAWDRSFQTWRTVR